MYQLRALFLLMAMLISRFVSGQIVSVRDITKKSRCTLNNKRQFNTSTSLVVAITDKLMLLCIKLLLSLKILQ